MATVKGYYNTKNETFLGPMTAPKDGGAASTPRYIEGVCFGSYDTDTLVFIPETNPMIIPPGSIMTVDEDPTAFAQGRHVEHVSGIEEDKGSEFAKKAIHLVNPKATPKRQQKLIMPGKLAKIDMDNLF